MSALCELAVRCLGVLAGLSVATRVGLALGALSLVIELGLRGFAPRSSARARWVAAQRAVGRAVTALALGVVYFLVLGPIALSHRLARRDPWSGEPLALRAEGLRARARRRSDRRSSRLPW